MNFEFHRRVFRNLRQSVMRGSGSILSGDVIGKIGEILYYHVIIYPLAWKEESTKKEKKLEQIERR